MFCWTKRRTLQKVTSHKTPHYNLIVLSLIHFIIIQHLWLYEEKFPIVLMVIHTHGLIESAKDFEFKITSGFFVQHKVYRVHGKFNEKSCKNLRFLYSLFVLFHGTSSVFSSKCFSSNIINTTAANTQNTKSPLRFINCSRLRRSFDFCLATTWFTTALDFSLVEFSMSDSVHSPSVLFGKVRQFFRIQIYYHLHLFWYFVEFFTYLFSSVAMLPCENFFILIYSESAKLCSSS